VILLGAGGAARAAARGVSPASVRVALIANRTAARLDALLAVLHAGCRQLPVRGFDPSSPPDGLPTGA